MVAIFFLPQCYNPWIKVHDEICNEAADGLATDFIPLWTSYKPKIAKYKLILPQDISDLTHCGLVTWVNIGSGNGLLPDCTKPLPEPMLTYHQWGSLAIIWGQFDKTYFKHHLLKWTWNLLI